MMEKPFSSMSLRHLVRISEMLMPGVSSIMMPELPMTPTPSTTESQSASEREPVLNFWASTPDSMDSRRLASCSLDISREKIRAFIRFFMATCCTMFRTKAVLPMDGRAATRIKSEGWKPAVR